MDTDLSAGDASFWGEDLGDESGYAVAGAGDVNGDGYDDLLIGALYDEEGESAAGQVYLILGKTTGWAMDTDLSTASASFLGEDGGDSACYSVAGAGDVNGDGYDDFLIGAQEDDYVGKTYLILGKATGWTTDTVLSNADASFIGEDADDEASIVAGAGDINGDGCDDFLIGAHYDADGGDSAGQTYLILGKAAGWATDTVLSNADASFWGEEEDDEAGYAVAGAGDVNGDGYTAALIGARREDDGGDTAGQSYLVLSDYSNASGTYKRVLPAGDVTAEDFSTARTEIDFSAGTVGTTTVIISRNHPSRRGVPRRKRVLGAVYHQDRLLGGRHVPLFGSEMGGLAVGFQKLCGRASAGSPWEAVPSQTLCTTNNTIQATGLTSFGQFTLCGTDSVAYLPVAVRE